ncbi:hypothetical protein NDU88_009965 [Pleurodeles waltl]|uniref:Uncharacterized protein n=1 Tax=Pleurodeles waltl TaxID=8319 RepID=A0AAV7S1X2_PLEWA|nr:hypothetical protein NDU88_009965 [Pleurodeles waltl]
MPVPRQTVRDLRKTRGDKVCIPDDFADEVQKERQRVMEAVALFGGALGGSDAASPLSLQKEDGHSDSDCETATSTQSSIVLPAITPGTADEII